MSNKVTLSGWKVWVFFVLPLWVGYGTLTYLLVHLVEVVW